MQKTTSILLTFTAAIMISCGGKTKPKEEPKTTIPDFTKTFEGQLNNEFDIIMTLRKNGNEVNGTYTYKSHGIPMNLSGKMDETGNCTLDESNAKGKVTGIFKGQLVDQKFTGTWTKSNGKNGMPFSLMETDKKESDFAKKDPAKGENWNDDWTGNYDDGGMNSLTIKGPDSEGKLNFEIVQGSEDCEGSSIEGIAYQRKFWSAQYSDENSDCALAFTYSTDKIEIKEYNCDDYHGAKCGTFDGVYTRKK